MPAAGPELVFNFAPGQNQFFVELAEALAFELAQLHVPARIAIGEYPEPRAGRVYVLLPPHEYLALSGFRPSAQILGRCIGISAEQPSSGFFPANLDLARDLGAVFDINVRAIRAYLRAGVAASHLQLGYCSQWDRFDDHATRDIDIIFMGRSTTRRDRALASYAWLFERFRCHLQLSDGTRPSLATATDFVAGDAKRDLLARAKVLLTIHGEDEPYFEWLRAVEAICAGCLVVTEHASDTAPLRSGEEIVTGGIDRLGALCAWAVDDERSRERIRRAAYDLLRTERRLGQAAAELARAAQRIVLAPLPSSNLVLPRADFVRASRRPAPGFELQPPTDPYSPGERRALRLLKAQALESLSLRRRLEHLESCRGGSATPQELTTIQSETTAWKSAPSRRLTVIVPLYNHATTVANALESVALSDRSDWEIVVVDDGSTDDGARVVREWMARRDWLACRLVRHAINRGLPEARNSGVAYAETDLLLMLDADNELLSTAMTRQLEALEKDPAASFAYGILAQFSADGPVALLSKMPWDPQRLRAANYIDALALIRRDALAELGGYSTDPRLHGWEDYDLWVRMADAGRHGAFVPEIIARYRVGHSSMVSFTNMSLTDAYIAVAEHAPQLMRGVRIPE